MGSGINPATGLPWGEEQDDGNFLFNIGAGVARGVAGAVENTVDLLPGVDLPENLGLGVSEDVPGALAEGITSFLTGFIPAVGILGKVGKLGKAINLTKKAEQAAKIAGKAGKARAIGFGRAAVAASISDFAVFDGNDPRLSNLLQDIPGMDNWLTDFLAADENDGEFVGRFKNVLEGAGLGIMTEGLFRVFKSLKTKNAAIRDKKPLEILRQIDKETAEAATDAVKTNVDPSEAAEKALFGVRKALPEGDENMLRLVSKMDFSTEDSAKFFKVLKAAKDSGVDPTEAIRGVVHLGKFSEKDVRIFNRLVMEEFDLEHFVKQGETLEQTKDRATAEFAKTIGQQPEVILAKLGKSAKAVEDARILAVAARSTMELHALDALEMAKAVDAGRGFQGMSLEQTALQVKNAVEIHGAIMSQYGNLRFEFGLGLGSFRIGAPEMSALQLARAIDDTGGLEGLKALSKKVIAWHADGAFGQRAAALTKRDRFWAMTIDWYMGSLLSGVKTITTNALGSQATAYFRPFERGLGAWIGKHLGRADQAAALKRTQAISLRSVTIMNQQMSDAVSYVTSKSFREGNDQPEVLKLFQRSFKSGEDEFLGGPGALEINKRNREGITAENVGGFFGRDWSKDEGMGLAIESFGKLVHVPGRTLMATDNFVKHLAYFAHFKSEIMEQGMERGLKGVDLDRWVGIETSKITRQGKALTVENLMREAKGKFSKNQFPDRVTRDKKINEWIKEQLDDTEVLKRSSVAKEAVRIAREVTFQTRLDPNQQGFLGSGGAHLMKFMQRQPAMRFFMPFVRTPVNLVVMSLERTPVPFVNRDFTGMITWVGRKITGKGKLLEKSSNRWIKQLYDQDPNVVADAYGRAATTMGFMTLFGTAALAGQITGRGPSDPDQRKILQQSGWQPHSIKVGDTYVSYQRGDPLASIMAFYADWVDIVKYDEGDDATVGEIMVAGLVATATNIENKSYLQGLVNLAGIIKDPQRFIPKSARQIGGGLFIPSLISGGRKITDPHANEVRGVLDAVINRVPGWGSATLDPQRTVLGEKVTKRTFESAMGRGAEGFLDFLLPTMLNHTSDDVITKELASLAYPFSNPKPKKYGIDFRDYPSRSGQTAYDRWLELTGEVRIKGRTLRSTLRRLIGSHDYQKLPEEGIGKADLESPRVTVLTNVLKKFRREAERQMFEEFPEVRGFAQAQLLARQALAEGESTDSVRARIFPLDN